MARHRGVQWRLPGHDSDQTVDNVVVNQALLMDIRDELQKLNRVFACPDFIAIPRTLTRIARNTTKKRRKK